MDILRAEAVGCFDHNIEEIGGFVSDNGMYAIHSPSKWKTVKEKIKSLGMFSILFYDVDLLKTTSMKNGLTNYVFECL